MGSLLSAFEAQPVDCARARLIHEPSKYRATLSVVRRRSPPDVVEDVERDLFGAGMVAENAHDQGEHQPVGAVVERSQSKLIARSNGFDKLAPFTF